MGTGIRLRNGEADAVDDGLHHLCRLVRGEADSISVSIASIFTGLFR